MSAAIFVGFDSAWTDSAKARGAICSTIFDGERFIHFQRPVLADFQQALAYIGALQRSDLPTLIALDQPTLVPNHVGMRPVEKVAASLISWIGGGVQPANRGKLAMFGPKVQRSDLPTLIALDPADARPQPRRHDTTYSAGAPQPLPKDDRSIWARAVEPSLLASRPRQEGCGSSSRLGT